MRRSVGDSFLPVDRDIVYFPAAQGAGVEGPRSPVDRVGLLRSTVGHASDLAQEDVDVGFIKRALGHIAEAYQSLVAATKWVCGCQLRHRVDLPSCMMCYMERPPGPQEFESQKHHLQLMWRRLSVADFASDLDLASHSPAPRATDCLSEYAGLHLDASAGERCMLHEHVNLILRHRASKHDSLTRAMDGMGWHCPLCTLPNEERAASCSVCFSPRSSLEELHAKTCRNSEKWARITTSSFDSGLSGEPGGLNLAPTALGELHRRALRQEARISPGAGSEAGHAHPLASSSPTMEYFVRQAFNILSNYTRLLGSSSEGWACPCCEMGNSEEVSSCLTCCTPRPDRAVGTSVLHDGVMELCLRWRALTPLPFPSWSFANTALASLYTRLKCLDGGVVPSSTSSPSGDTGSQSSSSSGGSSVGISGNCTGRLCASEIPRSAVRGTGDRGMGTLHKSDLGGTASSVGCGEPAICAIRSTGPPVPQPDEPETVSAQAGPSEVVDSVVATPVLDVISLFMDNSAVVWDLQCLQRLLIIMPRIVEGRTCDLRLVLGAHGGQTLHSLCRWHWKHLGYTCPSLRDHVPEFSSEDGIGVLPSAWKHMVCRGGHGAAQVDGESRVHQSLCAQVLSKITEPRAPGTLVLVVGKDVHSLDEELCGVSYLKCVSTALSLGWRAEVYSWRHERLQHMEALAGAPASGGRLVVRSLDDLL